MVQEASLITWQSFHYTERTEMDCHCSHIKLLTSTIEALIIPASRTMYATPCCSFIMQSYTKKQNPGKSEHICHLHTESLIFLWKGTFQKLLCKGSGNRTSALQFFKKFMKTGICSYIYTCNCQQLFKCKSECCLHHICMNLPIMNSNLRDDFFFCRIYCLIK